MKSCPRCEAVLEENAVRCGQCGKWVVTDSDVRRPKKKRSGGRKRLLLLGALILLAWAIWKFPVSTINPREDLDLEPPLAATLDAMKSDMEALLALQAGYFQRESVYAGSPSTLGFQASEGVTVSLIVTPTGWSAAATHEAFPSDVGCAVYGGSASPPRSPISPSEPGVVECGGGVK